MNKLYGLLILLMPFYGFSQSDELTTVLQKGHSAVVKAAAYSPDGTFIATASRDKSVKLWDAASGLEIRSLLGHKHTVNAVVFAPDGKTLATSSADNTARIWDVQTGQQLWQSSTANGYMTDVAFSPDGKWLAIGGYDWSMAVINVATGDTVKTIKVNPDKSVGYGIDLAFSPDGKWLAIGEDNRTAKVYHTETWKPTYTFKPTEGWCGGCATMTAFSPDGRYLAKVSNKGSVQSFDLQSGVQVSTFHPQVEDIAAIAYNKIGDQLLVANEDSVFVWDSQSTKLITQFIPEVKAINHATFHPEKPQILISGNDNMATLWNFEGQKTTELAGILQKRSKGGMDYDPDNYWESHIAGYIRNKNNLLLTKNAQYLLRGKVGKKARMWELNSGKTNMEFIGHEKAVLCFDMTTDEAHLVTGGGDGKAILWNTATGRQIRAFSGHREPIFDIEISHDQQKVATCSWDGKVMVWDMNTGKMLSTLYLDNVAAYNLAFSPNDVYLVLGKLDKTLELWEYDSKQLVKTFIGHTDIVTNIRWSDDPNTFLTTGKDGNVILWNMASGLIQNKFKHNGPVFDAIFMEPEKMITAGADRVIRVYNLSTGKVLHKLKGHQAAVTTLNMDRNENLLVSGDQDGVIKVWKLDTYEEFFEHVQIGDSDWMVRTSDGQFYATDQAMANIHFVRGSETYTLDQFFDEFYRPELLPELFELHDNSRQKSMNGMLDQSPPPLLKFGAYPENTDEMVHLDLKATNQGGGIKNLQLFHNGKRIDPEQVNLEVVEQQKSQHLYKLRAPLVAGHNVFTAKAYSKLNIASKPAEIDVVTDNTTAGSTCHILAVGIDAYQNPEMNLNYASKDARAFADSLQRAGQSIYSDIKMHTLYDKKATKDNILHKLDTLVNQVQLNDVFILYYAGHGSVVDDRFYFIPTESTRLYDSKTLNKQAIEASELQEKLKNIKALKQVIIMDACQSGKSVEKLAQRGALEEKAISQLARSSGIHVMASAGSEQYASEFVELGHGLFTYSLLKALSGQADGIPKDGKITVYEIKSYLDDQVPELSLKFKGKPQYPYSFSRGNDFPIGVKEK